MSIITKAMRCVTHTRFHRQVAVLNTINGIQNKYVHINSPLHMKMYMEHENKFAYNIMESKGYAISLISDTEDATITQDQFEEILQRNWTKSSPQDLYNTFPKLGIYCSQNNLCISNKIFDDYIDNFTDSIKQASDEELANIFYSLCKWPETESVRTRNYIEIWAALDDECFKRMGEWSYDKMLLYVALFFMLNISKGSDYTTKCLQRLASKAKQLSPGQLVQTLFYVGIMRRAPFDMHHLEVHLDNNFSCFTVDDLAVISMGFFKSKTPIRNMELVKKIINVTIENSKNVHEVCLAALLKVIRYSMKMTTDDIIFRLLDTLQHEVHRLSVMCNIHIALVGTPTLTYHEDCLNNIANRLVTDLPKARLKDLERLVLCFGIFNFIPKTKINFFDAVMNELRNLEREEEIRKYGRSFACCVSFLGILQQFPPDLINKALGKEFLDNTYGKNCFNYGREVLVLHNLAKIFCAGSVENQLTDKETKVLAKKYTDYMPDSDYPKQYNVAEKMVIDVVQTLRENRGGIEYAVGDHVLTHHQRGDVIICNSPDGTPLPVTSIFNNKNFGLIRNRPDNNIWIVFIIGGRHALIRNNGYPTGPFQIKMKELSKLGYYPCLVLMTVYEKLKTKNQKTAYLNHLIKEATKRNDVK